MPSLPVHTYLQQHQAAHLARLQTFLRQPSISAENAGVLETAHVLHGWLEERGAHVRWFGRDSHPLLFAEWNVGAPKTLLVYGMYDVQPVKDQTWTTPPFAAEIWDHPQGGPSVVARGACNSKGPLLALLHVIEAWQASGGLPVNIKWTLEGEEEIGSLALPGFYRQHRELLRADAAFEPFWSQSGQAERPVIILGTKGIAGLQVVCRGGRWGGPTEAIHSSLGPVVASPVWRLVRALNTLINDREELVVPGIPPLGEMLPGDEALLHQQAATLNLAHERQLARTSHFKTTDPVDWLRRLQFAPALNINGLEAGYTGAGGHTIIPCEARAHCDVRLPPGLTAEAAQAALLEHWRNHGFEDIEVVLDSGYPAARTPADAAVVQALAAAYQAHGHAPVLQPVEPSAVPYYLFTEVLGLPFACGGLGAAGGSHGPDEWCSVAGWHALAASVATFLHTFAQS